MKKIFIFVQTLLVASVAFGNEASPISNLGLILKNGLLVEREYSETELVAKYGDPLNRSEVQLSASGRVGSAVMVTYAYAGFIVNYYAPASQSNEAWLASLQIYGPEVEIGYGIKIGMERSDLERLLGKFQASPPLLRDGGELISYSLEDSAHTQLMVNYIDSVVSGITWANLP